VPGVAILALSGSLRQSSINSAALRAAARVAPRVGAVVLVDDSVRHLPLFDPDLEKAPPDSVRRFRLACLEAEAVLLAVPEYAFGIPGAFKNAIDWTVGSVALNRKPVAVLNVAPPGRGGHARAALAQVLQALDADVVVHAVPIAERDKDGDGELRAPAILDALEVVVADLARRAELARAA